MRGRKPLPTQIHRLRGTLNPTRHRSRETEPDAPPSGTLDAPGWLTDSQAAIWSHAIAHAPTETVRAIDAEALAVWVVAADQHRRAVKAQAALDAGKTLPFLTKGASGHPVISPLVSVIHHSALRMLKAASELGFTPASRPRISVSRSSAPKAESPWDRFAVVDGGKKA